MEKKKKKKKKKNSLGFIIMALIGILLFVGGISSYNKKVEEKTEEVKEAAEEAAVKTKTSSILHKRSLLSISVIPL